MSRADRIAAEHRYQMVGGVCTCGEDFGKLGLCFTEEEQAHLAHVVEVTGRAIAADIQAVIDWSGRSPYDTGYSHGLSDAAMIAEGGQP